MAKFAAFGSQLQIGDTNYLPVYATIAQLKTISGPDMSAETADVTNHQSPNRFREFVKPVIDGGEVSCDVIWDADETTHQDVRDAAKSVNSRLFHIIEVFTGAPVVEFEGFVTGAEISRDAEDAITGSITIKVTGEPLYWDEVTP
ncbi:MAG: hypothetical protein A3J75_06555 [Acidobacteria bacterium RBG_16_68_9]|nr:MAG: hypothetical protein A3J75_06555 [Acidobacteria bacterium RBG_16_68_9]